MGHHLPERRLLPFLMIGVIADKVLTINILFDRTGLQQ